VVLQDEEQQEQNQQPSSRSSKPESWLPKEVNKGMGCMLRMANMQMSDQTWHHVLNMDAETAAAALLVHAGMYAWQQALHTECSGA
jgi:hypothetical protein